MSSRKVDLSRIPKFDGQATTAEALAQGLVGCAQLFRGATSRCRLGSRTGGEGMVSMEGWFLRVVRKGACSHHRGNLELVLPQALSGPQLVAVPVGSGLRLSSDSGTIVIVELQKRRDAQAPTPAQPSRTVSALVSCLSKL